MITTLVLGAGMSSTYGDPTGSELVDKVKAMLAAEEDNISWGLLKQIDHLGLESLDELIDQNKNAGDILKPIIASIIHEHEQVEQFNKPTSESPYHMLVRQIPPERFKYFRIVSFNYDRSLEFFLSRSLQTRYACSPAASFEKLAALKIIHVHGRLLALPGERAFANPAYPNGFSYGQYNINHQTTIASPEAEMNGWHWRWQGDVLGHVQQNLKTCFENQAANADAENAIRESDRVIFLGFGFHASNMKTLGYPFGYEDKGTKRVPATAWKLSGTEKRRIVNAYPQVHLFENCACAELLSEHVSLEEPAHDDPCLVGTKPTRETDS